MRLLCLVALLLPGLSLGAPTSLESARSSLRALKYQDAARLLEQVSTAPDLTLPEAVDFYVLDGLVKGSLGRTVPAKQAFQCALVIDPNAKLPTKAAPRVSTPFLEAKALAKDHGPLAVQLVTKTRGPTGWTMEFALGRDDLKLVKQVAFEVVEDGVSRSLVVDIAQLGRLSVGALNAEVSWTLRGARGWSLSPRQSVRLEPPAPEARLEPAPPPVADLSTPAVQPVSQPSLAPALVTIGSGAVVAGVGGAFLFVASNAAERATQATTSEELQDRLQTGRRSQFIGVPLLAVGGAAIATGVVLLFIRPSATSVSVAPIHGGGIAVFSGAFR